MSNAIVTKLEIGLVSLIKNATTAAGDRIYPDLLPQKVTYPAITYSDVSDMGHIDIGVDYPRYNITVWSPRRIEAKNLAETILNLLHGYKNVLNTVRVKNISKMPSPGTLYDKEAGEDEKGVYYIPQDFKIIYERVT